MPRMERPPRIAVLGAGTVGSAVIDRLDRLVHATVLPVLVRDPERPRPFSRHRERVTTDAAAATAGADLLVELMGGIEPAAGLMLDALRSGIPVVTANKAALAERWHDFQPFIAAGKLYFEAAVMAGTPVVGPLTGALRGSAPVALHAVLNGTCNVILSAMEEGASYEDALVDAQVEGFAEEDPSLDVDGVDTAHKLAILGRMVFDPALSLEALMGRTRGIRAIDAATLQRAAASGHRVRLVGSIVAGNEGWEASVMPTTLPAGHPLASLDGANNGMVFCGDAIGEVLIRGSGAGAAPTASGVVADVLAALAGRPGPTPVAEPAALPAHRTPAGLPTSSDEIGAQSARARS